jgi:epoxyqueuosine reductase
LARLACPIAPEHQYDLEQVQYHYGRSLQMIRP